PYFMTAGASTNSQAGQGSNVQTSIENFASYDDWKGLLDKVKTLWGKDTTEDKSKLDAFSNALAPLLIDAALNSTTIERQTNKVTITKETTIFYVKPWTGDFTFGSKDEVGKMAVNGQSSDTQIGANKTTLLLSGYQGYETVNNKVTANGKPWNKDKVVSGTNVVGNGTSSNYFEIDSVKWHFNGGSEKLLGLPRPETTGDTPTSATYDSGLAVAIRFLIEAVITDDTMTRTTTPSGEVSNQS
ncbi:hypothetical protein, partial [Mycoplasmopsis agassizii]